MEEQKKNDRVTVNLCAIFSILCYVVGAISIFMAFKWYNCDLDIYSSGDAFQFHERRYVGGDAYNYMISASRSATIMTKSVVWMIFGCSSVIIGRLFSNKLNLCK